MPVAADIARTLDTHCPLDAHVVITIAPVVGRWGESWYDEAEDVYRIVVSPLAKDADFFAEVFMHEWAHCRTACDCVDPHCEHWGVEYAACYRACIER